MGFCSVLMVTAALCHKKRTDGKQSWKIVPIIPVRGNKKASSFLLPHHSTPGTLDTEKGSEDSVGAFRLKGKTLITYAHLPSLRSFSKTSHETCPAITFPSSTISPVWAALLQNVLCSLQVVSYSKLQVIKTPSAPWQKQQIMKKHQKCPTSVSSFPPSKRWQAEVQNKHHLYEGNKLYSENYSMSQELTSTTFPPTP